jgi:uncharacterized protein YbjT (DUF2867 family)
MAIEKQNENKLRALILGATGRTGSKVISELERIDAVQVVYSSRKLAQVEAWRRDGKDAVLLDLDQPETFPDESAGESTLKHAVSQRYLGHAKEVRSARCYLPPATTR